MSGVVYGPRTRVRLSHPLVFPSAGSPVSEPCVTVEQPNGTVRRAKRVHMMGHSWAEIGPAGELVLMTDYEVHLIGELP